VRNGAAFPAHFQFIFSFFAEAAPPCGAAIAGGGAASWSKASVEGLARKGGALPHNRRRSRIHVVFSAPSSEPFREQQCSPKAGAFAKNVEGKYAQKYGEGNADAAPLNLLRGF
jgi:hypothetical protein